MAASIRIQILQVIRDAVDAVLPGGCDMPRRRGLDMTKPRAIVYYQGDAAAGATTRVDGGPGTGGVQLRTLSVVVDVYTFDPDKEPVSIQNPTGEDPSLVEALDEMLVLAEDAIKALWIPEPATALGTTWRALGADGTDPVADLPVGDDGRLVCGRLTFDVRYTCAERTQTEAA